MEYNEKNALSSRGVLGGVLAVAGVVVPMIANFFGYEISPDDVSYVVSQGAVVVGGVLAVWGRIKATKRIR